MFFFSSLLQPDPPAVIRYKGFHNGTIPNDPIQAGHIRIGKA